MEGIPVIPDRELLNTVAEQAFSGYDEEKQEITINHCMYEGQSPFHVKVVFHVDELGDLIFKTCLNIKDKCIDNFISDESVELARSMAQYILARLNPHNKFDRDDEQDMDEIDDLLEFEEQVEINDYSDDEQDMILVGIDINDSLDSNFPSSFQIGDDYYVDFDID